MTDTAKIARFYNENVHAEHERLQVFKLEHRVSLHIILESIKHLGERFPGQKSLNILDLGGGTGRYAVELTKRGHQVTLSDISESELEQAKLHARDCNTEIAHVAQSDARDVRLNAELYKKEHFHVVLCQGPLYHLLDKQERQDLLATLAEVTIPGGFILTAFVTMFAHLRDIANKDPGRLLLKKTFYTEYLKTGNYTANPATGMHHFHVDEIRDLFQHVSSTSRLSLERLVACEGFLGGRLSASLSGLDEQEFQEWLQVILQFAEDPSALASADHLLAVARKL